jgi:protoporphyrin/coproporphyrin ferrochelatase
MTNGGKAAILLLAHGSPARVEEVPEFLLRVRGGRPLPREAVEEVEHRYRAIGKSPLTEITVRQAELLAKEMATPVYVGMRNWHPFIAQALEQMQADGIRSAIVICMAPHNSRTSVGLYRKALTACSDPELLLDFVESWHDEPWLVQAFAQKLKAGREKANREYGGAVPVIFTAHSVPERTVLEGDLYASQAKQTAHLVALSAGLKAQEWTFAFQSQGMAGGPWLGPTVQSTILDLKQAGHNGVFIQPIGFLCDHVEVLYDIDIVFEQFAKSNGMRLWRAESLNDSPLLTSALEAIVRSRMAVAIGAADRA